MEPSGCMLPSHGHISANDAATSSGQGIGVGLPFADAAIGSANKPASRIRRRDLRIATSILEWRSVLIVRAACQRAPARLRGAMLGRRVTAATVATVLPPGG